MLRVLPSFNTSQVVLFERVTFLVIAQCSRKQHHDVHRFEKISNIIKQFKLSCGRSQSQPLSMHISNSTFSAFVGSFTSNTAIMVVSTDPDVRVASTEMNVKLARPGASFCVFFLPFATRHVLYYAIMLILVQFTRAQYSRSSLRRMRVPALRLAKRGYRVSGNSFQIKLVITVSQFLRALPKRSVCSGSSNISNNTLLEHPIATIISPPPRSAIHHSCGSPVFG